jgi:hypothetical protein
VLVLLLLMMDLLKTNNCSGNLKLNYYHVVTLLKIDSTHALEVEQLPKKVVGKGS